MKQGDIVYIQGFYKAKIHHMNNDGTITCRVYEGTPYGNPHRNIYTYQPSLIKTKRHIIKKSHE